MDESSQAGTTSTRHRTRTNGQAAVEFALIAPVFLLLLLIAVDFGRLFFTYIQLSNTAREAAAYAAINPTTDNATLTTVAMRESNVQAQRGQGAISAAATCTDSAGTTIACTDAGGGTGAGNRVVATVHETFTFFTPLIGNFWPGGLQVGTSATAPVYAVCAGWRNPSSSVHHAASHADLHLAEPGSRQPSEPDLGRRDGVAEPAGALPDRGIRLGLRGGQHWQPGDRRPARGHHPGLRVR